MDKDLQKLINETVEQFFEGAPEKMIEKGCRPSYYDICPHCKKEIHEKAEYSDDGGITFRHSLCKGLISRPETPLDEIVDWLRPAVAEARKQRHEAKMKMGLNNDEYYPNDLPPSGEEKYNKQEPGGKMAACNVATIANESKENKVTKKEEILNISPGVFGRMKDESILISNLTNIYIKTTIVEIDSPVDQFSSIKKYIIKIENG